MPTSSTLPVRPFGPATRAILAAIGAAALLTAALPARAGWRTHAGDAQHTAQSTVPAQPLQVIHWQTPVDLAPQYSGSNLLIHYGSPLVTEGNTVLFAVKLGVADTFRVEARRGRDGSLLWTLDTDLLLPPHNWTPSVGLTLTPQGRVYVPAAGGTLLWTDALDAPGAHSATRVAFFGDAAYAANTAAMNASLRICTPLTGADDGSVYFGVRAVSTNPLGITSGLACVDRNGNGRFVSASDASAGLCTQIAMNCAPALSADGSLLYLAGRGSTSNPGYLLALRTADLTTRAIVAPMDPLTGQPSTVPNDGTSSPMVAPDGRVFYGVLGTPFGTNASRGWLLQFDSLLVSTGAPGAFGWDVTPSLVPTSAVPGYAGSAAYLLATKYNLYAGAGDGVNKLAVLDPDDTQFDAFATIPVMKEVLLMPGPTPDPDPGPWYPNAVKEWCINTVAVDPFTNAVLAGSEDGKLYRWDLASNALVENVVLTPGLGEAYTPTLVGPDGQVYAINNATLFAVGATQVGVAPGGPASGVSLAPAVPSPSADVTTLRFSLANPARVTLEVLDLTGQRVASLWHGPAGVGEHTVRWDGRDERGTRRAPGMYFVRLAAGEEVVSGKLLRVW